MGPGFAVKGSKMEQNASTCARGSLDVVGRRLESVNVSDSDSIDSAIDAMKELREYGMEMSLSQVYFAFLRQFLPKLELVLRVIPPQFEQGKKQQLRYLTLDFIRRLPVNEILREFTGRLLGLVTRCLSVENEDNSLLCLTVFFELCRTYRPRLDDSVLQTFIDFAHQCYTNFPKSVSASLNGPVRLRENGGKKNDRTIPRAFESFRVISECPLTMMLLMQLNHTWVSKKIGALLPVAIQALHSYQDKKNQFAAGDPKLLKDVGSQILKCLAKTLSFIVYLVRSPQYIDTMKKYQLFIGKAVANLLKESLSADKAIRKDILMATRHLLATEFRKGFVPLIHDFFQKNLLLGGFEATDHPVKKFRGQSNLKVPFLMEQSDLIALSYSTFADFVHYMRDSLSIGQYSQSVHILTCMLNDFRLPAMIQNTSVKLLLDIVDRIYRFPANDRPVARQLFSSIFEALVLRLEYLSGQVFRADQMEQKKAEKQSKSAVSDLAADLMSQYPFINPDTVIPKPEKKSRSAREVKLSYDAMKYIYKCHNGELINRPDAQNLRIGHASSLSVNDGSHSATDTISSSLKRKRPESIDNIKLVFGCIENGINGIEALDGLKEFQTLTSTIFVGLKTVLWCMCSFDAHVLKVDVQTVGANSTLTAEEIVFICSALRSGFQCLYIFSWGTFQEANKSTGNCRLRRAKCSIPTATKRSRSSDILKQHITKLSAYEIEMIERFAEVFSVLDPVHFADIFQRNIGLVFEQFVRHPISIAFARKLLRNGTISHCFFRIMLRFVIERLPELAGEFGVEAKSVFAQEEMQSIFYTSRLKHIQSDPIRPKLELLRNFGFVESIAQHFVHSACDRPKSTSQDSDAFGCNANPSSASSSSCFDYFSLMMNGKTALARNYVAVLAQMLELLFDCLESLTENQIAGNGPSSASYLARAVGVEKWEGTDRQGSKMSSSSRITIGWDLANSFQESFEQLFITLLVFAPELSSASQMETRGRVHNPGMLELAKKLGLRHPDILKWLRTFGAKPETVFFSDERDNLYFSLSERNCFLIALRSILRVIAKRPILQHLLKGKIMELLGPSLRALSELLYISADGSQRGAERTRKHLVAEVILLIAARIPISILPRYFPILHGSIEVSLLSAYHQNLDLTKLTLRLMERWLDNLGPDVFGSLLSLDTFSASQEGVGVAHALSRLVRYVPPIFGSSPLRILGKLGEHARKALVKNHFFSSSNSFIDSGKDYSCSKGKFLVKGYWNEGNRGPNSTSDKSIFCFDGILREAIKLLQDKYTPRRFIKNELPLGCPLHFLSGFSNQDKCNKECANQILEILESLESDLPLSQRLDKCAMNSKNAVNLVCKPSDSSTRLSKVKALDLLLFAIGESLAGGSINGFGLCCCREEKCKCKVFNKRSGNEEAVNSHSRTADFLISDKGSSSMQELFSEMLFSLAESCSDTVLSEPVWPILKGFVQCILLDSFASFSFLWRDSMTRSSRAIDRESHSGLECENLSVKPDVDFLVSCPNIEILCDVVTKMLCTACSSHSFVGLRMLELVISAAMKVEKNKGNDSEYVSSRFFWGNLVDVLLRKLLAYCHGNSWVDRFGGCVGIRRLLQVTSCEYLCESYIDIVEGLCFVLENHQVCMGIEVFFQAMLGIQEVLMYGFSWPACREMAAGTLPINAKSQAPQQPKVVISRLQHTVLHLIGLLTSQHSNSRAVGKYTMLLLAQCHNLSIGEMLIQCPMVLSKLKHMLTSHDLKNKELWSQRIFLDTATFILRQKPSPLDLFADFGTKRTVQMLADTVLLAERAEAAGKYSFISSFHFEEKHPRSCVYSSATSAPGNIFMKKYSFEANPLAVQIHASSIWMIGACLKSGGTNLLITLNSDAVSQRVRDRLTKLIIHSCLSPWYAVTLAAKDAVTVLGAQTNVVVSRNPDIFAIPPALITSLLSAVVKVLASVETLYSRPMFEGIAVLTKAFRNPQFLGGVMETLFIQLGQIFSRPLDCPGVSPNSHSMLQAPLSGSRLAEKIIFTFSCLPENLVRPRLGDIFRTTILLIERADQSSHRASRPSITHSYPFASYFGEFGGPLSSPIWDGLLRIFEQYPDFAISTCLNPSTLIGRERIMRLFFEVLLSGDMFKFASVLTNISCTDHLLKGFEARLRSENDLTESICFGMRLIRVVSEYEPLWTLQPAVIETILSVCQADCVVQYWLQKRVYGYLQRHFFVDLCTVLMTFFRCVNRPLNAWMNELPFDASMISLVFKSVLCVFEILCLATARPTCHITALTSEFLENEVASSSSHVMKMAILCHYLVVVDKLPRRSVSFNEAALRLIVLPIVARAQTDRKLSCPIIEISPGLTLENALVKVVLNGGLFPEQHSAPFADFAEVESVSSGWDTYRAHAERSRLLSEGALQIDQNHVSASTFQSLLTLMRCESSTPKHAFLDICVSDDLLQARLLQLSALLIVSCGSAIQEHRRELIKFVWNQCRSEFSLTRQWAHINISAFIRVYDTPTDVALQLFVAIIRDSSSQGRHLVSCAFDVLVPFLSRLSFDKSQSALKYVRKLISDEGHKFPVMVNIWLLIARHPDFFYGFRSQFAPHLVSSLGKLCSPQGGAPENFELAVDLVKRFLQWELLAERTCKSESRSETGNASFHWGNGVDHEQSDSKTDAEYNSTFSFYFALAQFLIRTIFLFSDSRDSSQQSLKLKCVSLFRILIDIAGRLKVPILSPNLEETDSKRNCSDSKCTFASRSIVSSSNMLRYIDAAVIKCKNAVAGKSEALARMKSSGNVSGTRKLRTSSRKDININPVSHFDIVVEPGPINCILEVVHVILTAEPSLVAFPFLAENISFIQVLTTAAMDSPDRITRVLLLQLLAALVRLCPFDSNVHQSTKLSADKKSARIKIAIGTQKFYEWLLENISTRFNGLSTREWFSDRSDELNKPLSGKSEGSASPKYSVKNIRRNPEVNGQLNSGAGEDSIIAVQLLRILQLFSATSSDVFISESANAVLDGSVEGQRNLRFSADRLKRVSDELVNLFLCWSKYFRQISSSALENRTTLGSSNTSIEFLSRAVFSSTDSRETLCHGMDILIHLLMPLLLMSEPYRQTCLPEVVLLLEELSLAEEQVLLSLLKLVKSLLVSSFDASKADKQNESGTSCISAFDRYSLLQDLQTLRRFWGLPQAANLSKAYCDLIFEVCVLEDSIRVKDGEITNDTLDKCFADLLLSPSSSQRKKYFEYFENHHLKYGSIASRLSFVLDYDWLNYGTQNWLPVAVRIILYGIRRMKLNLFDCEESLCGDNFVKDATLSRGCPDIVRLILRKRIASIRVLESLSELCFEDASCRLVHQTWLTIFPNAWCTIAPSQQSKFNDKVQKFLLTSSSIPEEVPYLQACVIGKQLYHKSQCDSLDNFTELRANLLLSREPWDPYQDVLWKVLMSRTLYHIRAALWPSQYLLGCLFEGIANLNPSPTLEPEIVQHLGKHFDVFATAVKFAESVLTKNKCEMKRLDGVGNCFQDIENVDCMCWQLGSEFATTENDSKQKVWPDSKSGPVDLDLNEPSCVLCRWLAALLDLYRYGMDEMIPGILRQNCSSRVMHSGLLCEATQNFPKALSMYAFRLKSLTDVCHFLGSSNTDLTDFDNSVSNETESGISLSLETCDHEANCIVSDACFPLERIHNPCFCNAALHNGLKSSKKFDFDGDLIKDKIHMISPADELSDVPGGRVESSSRLKRGYEALNADMKPLSVMPSVLEVDIWTDRWIECAKALGMWNDLYNFCDTREQLLGVLYLSDTLKNLPLMDSIISEQKADLKSLEVIGDSYLPRASMDIWKHTLGTVSSLYEVVCSISDIGESSELESQLKDVASKISFGHFKVCGGINSSILRSSLFYAQRFVELEESVAYVRDVLKLASAPRDSTIENISKVNSSGPECGTGTTHRSNYAQGISREDLRVCSSNISRTLRRWRSRVSSGMDDSENWNTVLLTRDAIFKLAIRLSFQAVGKTSLCRNDFLAGETMQSCFDIRWTALERAKMFRNNGLTDQALQVLTEGLTQSRASPEQQFMHSRERIINLVLSDHSGSSGSRQQHAAGELDLLLKTDTSGFSPENEAEFLRIQALCREQVHDSPDFVHQLYADSVKRYPKSPRNWLSWALYASKRLDTTYSSCDEDSFLNYSSLSFIFVSGILQAIKKGSTEARLSIPKILLYLHYESEALEAAGKMPDTPNIASKVLIQHLDLVPTWVWLPWISQIVTFFTLNKASSIASKPLLHAICREYPNAVYYILRAQFLSDYKDVRVDNSSKNGSNSGNGSLASSFAYRNFNGAHNLSKIREHAEMPPAMSSSTSIDPLNRRMATLKSALSTFHDMHPVLFQELETIVDEFSSAYRKQNPIEELYATICQMLDRCIFYATAPTSRTANHTHTPVSNQNLSSPEIRTVEVTLGSGTTLKVALEPERLALAWLMLDRVCKKLFSPSILGRSDAHCRFLNRIRNDFEKDFLPDQKRLASLKESHRKGDQLNEPHRDMSLRGIISRIGVWQNFLKKRLGGREFDRIPLYRWSRQLAILPPCSAHIPGLHMLKDGLSKPQSSNHSQIHAFCPFVKLFRSDGTGSPSVRVEFQGYNGHSISFLIKDNVRLNNVSSDHRIVQLGNMLNSMLDSSSVVKNSKNLSYLLPVVVPIHVRLSMQLMYPNFRSLESIFEQEMERLGTSYSKRAICCKFLEQQSKYLVEAESGDLPKSLLLARAVGFSASSKMAPKDLLLNYLRDNSTESASLLSARVLLAKSTALWSLLSLLLQCGSSRTPNRIMINPFNGSILEFEVRPKFLQWFNNSLDIAGDEGLVPFRLTPNIEQAFPFLATKGIFIDSMVMAAHCFSSDLNKDRIRSLLELHFIEEVVSNQVGQQKLSWLGSSANNMNKIHKVARPKCQSMLSIFDKILFQSDGLSKSGTFMDDGVDEKEVNIRETLMRERSCNDNETIYGVSEIIRQAIDSERLGWMNFNFLPWF